jgi:hypothetical protein
MTDDNWAALALPRRAPIEDPDAYLQTAMRWHFGSETGSRYWLGRVKDFDFDPLTDVKSFADLTQFPNIVDELRDVPVEDLVPAGYGASPPMTIWESGGTTGAPKRVVAPLDWIQQLAMWLVEELDEPAIRGGGLLFVGPTGPHMFGQIQRHIAACIKARLFYIDLDPRWVKKLVARGASDEISSYVEHLVAQAELVLRSQDIRLLTTTPPLLQAIARSDELIELINAKVRRIQVGGAHLDEDTRTLLREVFPKARLHNLYGSTMILGASKMREPVADNDAVIHDPHSPYITFTVIDPNNGDPVRYGQRGQVVMNHVSRAMFLPNNLERDSAIRVPAPDGQVGDSVSEVKPVELFGGQPVTEGVY